MKIIYRFSFLSCVLSDERRGVHTRFPREAYLVNSSFANLKHFDINLLPEDYNGDNYDLIFDKDCNFIRAEKDLDITHNLK